MFWSGFLPFPLTDFPALAMSMLALVCVSRSNSPAWMLVAGLSTAAAINMRPSYVLILPIIVVLMFWAWFERRPTGQVLIKRGGLCIGLLIVAFLRYPFRSPYRCIGISVPGTLSWRSG